MCLVCKVEVARCTRRDNMPYNSSSSHNLTKSPPPPSSFDANLLCAPCGGSPHVERGRTHACVRGVYTDRCWTRLPMGRTVETDALLVNTKFFFFYKCQSSVGYRVLSIISYCPGSFQPSYRNTMPCARATFSYLPTTPNPFPCHMCLPNIIGNKTTSL